MKLPEGKFKYIAVDFDGTLFTDAWPGIGKPRQEIIQWALAQQREGAKVILHTCREGNRLTAAILASNREGLHFDAVNENPFTPWMLTEHTKKPYADIYLDDKAWRV